MLLIKKIKSIALYLLSLIYLVILNIWKVIQSFKGTTSFDDSLIISCGNIAVGGSGKTPLCCYICEHFKKETNYKIAIVTRGYGRKTIRPKKISPEDKVNDTKRFGDEPIMINKKLPFVSIFIDSNRKRAINLARKDHKIIILDDGFQQLSIKKNIDLVLFDGQFNINDLKILPRGRLREKLNSINRCTAIVITKSNINPKNTNKLKEKISTIHKNKKIYEFSYLPLGWYDINGNKADNNQIKGTTTVVVSAIANPNSFNSITKKYNFKIKEYYNFPDHHQYKLHDLEKIINNQITILTTEKDVSKLLPFKKYFSNIFYVKMELVDLNDFKNILNLNLKKINN